MQASTQHMMMQASSRQMRQQTVTNKHAINPQPLQQQQAAHAVSTPPPHTHTHTHTPHTHLLNQLPRSIINHTLRRKGRSVVQVQRPAAGGDASRDTCHMQQRNRGTRHTSNVTRHTSHVTRHTSHPPSPCLSLCITHPPHITLHCSLRTLACGRPRDEFYNQNTVAFGKAPFAGHLEGGEGGVEGLEGGGLNAVFVDAVTNLTCDV